MWGDSPWVRIPPSPPLSPGICSGDSHLTTWEVVLVPEVFDFSAEEVMDELLAEAARASMHGDIPIAAGCVFEGKLIAKRHNEKQIKKDSFGHAEILALKDAVEILGGPYLTGVTLVATLEPCLMCAGSMLAHRIEGVVFAASDPKGGAVGSLYNLASDPRLNHQMRRLAGVREKESSLLLMDFFESLRF